MQVTHQVSDDMLAGYAAGTLPEAFNIVIATHLTLCPAALERLRLFQDLGGVLIEETEPVALAPGSLESTLARLIAEEPPAPAPPAPVLSCDILPEPLSAAVGGDIAAVRWRPIGMGARQAIIPTTGPATLRLLRIPGGAALPDHGHSGTEMTLVLQGAYCDGADVYARGDLEIADEATEHTPTAEPGPACICVVAAHGRLRFSGLLPRLAQPFIRI